MDQALNGISGGASLITAVNVLNEFRPSRETPLHTRLEALTRRIAARLAPGGRFLAMEPGTRLGGKLMALTRQAGFSARLVPESPCPHWKACPMLARSATGWCHFSHLAGAVPQSLAALTKQAGLGKKNLSLSCLVLRQATEEETARAEAFLPALPDDDDFFGGLLPGDRPADRIGGPDSEEEDGFAPWPEAFTAVSPALPENRGFIRILSDPIRLPGLEEPARYACSEKGLVLARDALRLPSGAAVTVRWPEREHHDPKSGALVVVLPPSRHGQPSLAKDGQPSPAEGGRKVEKPPREPRKPGRPPARNTGKPSRGPVPSAPESPKRRTKPETGMPRARNEHGTKSGRKKGDRHER